MRKGYKHLTYEQRCQIEVLLKRNLFQKEIAKAIKATPSQVCRELKNHANKDGRYSAKAAQRKASRRKIVNRNNPKKIRNHLEEWIKEKLALGWSPIQISGRLWLDYKKKISASGIYIYIAKNKKLGGKLYLNLRHKGRKKRDYNRKKAGKSLIPSRVDIAERPSIVESKLRIGDWEGDTIVGRGKKSGIITLVDRHSKMTIMAKINNFKSENVMNIMIKFINKNLRHQRHKLRTITFDNGLEFASHNAIPDAFPGVNVYFAKPFKSWQRGLNEHTNGLIREYFPKGTDFNELSDLQIAVVQNKLNNRPRAVLNFKTPQEVFFRDYSKH